MLGRLLRKLVLVISIALAVLLMRTRHTDLLIGGAKANMYHELRLGDGQLAFMQIDMWGADERVSWGRIADDWKQYATSLNARSGGGRLIRMLDGAVIVLERGTESGPWSPVKRTDGRVLVAVFSARHRNPPPIVTTPITTQPYSKFIAPPDLSKIKVTVAAPSPFSKPSDPAKATGDDLLTSLKDNTSLALRVPPKPPPEKPVGMGMFISAPAVRVYRYERWALPVWAVIGVILVPLWWTIARALARRRRRTRRRRGGQCEECGYDLRGIPDADACPECGTRRPGGQPAPPATQAVV